MTATAIPIFKNFDFAFNSECFAWHSSYSSMSSSEMLYGQSKQKDQIKGLNQYLQTS